MVKNFGDGESDPLKRKENSLLSFFVSMLWLFGFILAPVTLSAQEWELRQEIDKNGTEGQKSGILYEIEAVVTAYSSSKEETDETPLIMANGENVRPGVLACPRKFKFGTKFLIGGRVYECTDRMHKKYDSRFDVWMESREKALRFGKQKLVVYVLGITED